MQASMKLTPVKADRKWNDMYWDLCDIAMKIVKKEAWMKIFNASRPQYLGTDMSGVSLGAGVLQVRSGMNCGCDEVPDSTTLWPVTFASKNLSSTQQHYSIIEFEAQGILHGLEKFHHYCFARVICIITDHKPLVAIPSKDVAMLSQWLHHIILCILQYRVHIIYKPGPDLHIFDWLSRNNHIENKDQEITGMTIYVNAVSAAVNLPVCNTLKTDRW